MELVYLLEHIPLGTKVAIERNQSVVVATVKEHLSKIELGEIFLVDEIDPDGYTDANGITYMKIYTRE